MSKYEAIYKDILGRIEQNLYAAGDTLPGEYELMKIYEASRDTIRKALLLLAQNGYIQKSKGRGSIVLDRQRYDFPVSGVVSFKELADKMEQDVQELSNKRQNGLMEDNNANSLLFRDSINAFLKEYNKTRGYSLIFSNTGFDNLLYADSAYNITKEIVDGLNARYSSAKK